jgi:hypothetical protein
VAWSVDYLFNKCKALSSDFSATNYYKKEKKIMEWIIVIIISRQLTKIPILEFFNMSDVANTFFF